ncbi:kinase [Rhodospirillum sp. A1_3_36]|uniref:GHMP family kinase ATP-binding protein n=1 Tax=Rhodospirillum sp. A1_3_36 TaxID=3391666 RepID=UPI0039A65589
MIMSRTPFRVSFFGGGTDYPDWYLKEGGAVLSSSIDKYIYITCRYLPPFFDMRHRIVWSRIESVWKIDEIQHPAVREALLAMEFTDANGLDIHYQGDLPARSGMGSSSTFSVGLLNALSALRGQRLSKKELTSRAIDLERNRLKEHVGAQDQTAAAYGGLNFIEFMKTGDIRVEPLTLNPERLRHLESHLMLFYSGLSRSSSELAGQIIANIGSRQDQLRRMRRMVDKGIDVLCGSGPLSAFGELLHEGWCLKRELSQNMTNAKVDGIYETARENGALGGKLLGAGESGFMLFFVPPECQKAVKRALGLLHVPFELSWEGSTIIQYDPDTVTYPDRVHAAETRYG